MELKTPWVPKEAERPFLMENQHTEPVKMFIQHTTKCIQKNNEGKIDNQAQNTKLSRPPHWNCTHLLSFFVLVEVGDEHDFGGDGIYMNERVHVGVVLVLPAMQLYILANARDNPKVVCPGKLRMHQH